ncbi:MAG: helix-turn-helix domain-containing protein [Clostridia bacterium]|nr:helix-turn-helix domain-containing protein [Clostridia bacterium]MDE6356047.1 helix-turn-helix domain-containing protein [Clostridia bacterium]
MNEFDKKVLGERLKYLRNEKGLGQNLLAKELKLSNASISYWETGKQEPSAEALFKLAKYFNVSADYLLGLTDD